MPIYPFYCKKCGHSEELFLKMSDDKPTVCPKNDCLGEYCRDYAGIGAVIDSNQPKTIGDLADANTERLVKEGKIPKSTLSWDTKRKEIRKKKEHAKDIAKMTPAQKTHYIMTGEKKI
jgi:putative FmdB family regulatory protein